jgi:hypothetical protein
VETLATFPSVVVAAGDLIVVHLNAATAAGAAPGSETLAKNEYASASFSANYDGAWDFHGGNAGLTNSNRVLRLESPASVILDAIAVVLSTAPTPPGAFPGDLQALQAAGLWLPADCNSMLCDYGSTPSAIDISVDYLGAGTTPTGNTIARQLGLDTMQKSDWNAAGPHSLGLPNP